MLEMMHLPGEILSFSWNSHVKVLYELRNLRSALCNTRYLKATFLNFLIKKSVRKGYLIWYFIFISGYSHLLGENTNRDYHVLNFPSTFLCFPSFQMFSTQLISRVLCHFCVFTKPQWMLLPSSYLFLPWAYSKC